MLDLTTIFQMLWKDIYNQLHDYLLKTRVEVYLVVYSSDNFLSVCVTWYSRLTGKMEITTLECSVDLHYTSRSGAHVCATEGPHSSLPSYVWKM